MFNQFSPAEVVAAIGRTALDAARSPANDDKFARGQLVSAASTCKHLSVELANYSPYLMALARDVAASAGGLLVAQQNQKGMDALSALAEADNFVTIGAHTSEVLDALRTIDPAQSMPVRKKIQHLMHDLTEREVRLLAATIEPDRPTPNGFKKVAS